jgi:hypothetical protein
VIPIKAQAGIARAAGRHVFVPARGLSRARGGNVVLSLFHSPETELALVAEEYHKAAKLLIEKGVTNDLAAYPIVYLYRHALELSIKSVLILGGEVRIVPVVDPLKHGHKLLPLLTQLEQLFGAQYARHYKELEEIVKEFDEVDPENQAFRYTFKRNRNPSMEPGFAFSVARMAKVLDPVLERLSGGWATHTWAVWLELPLTLTPMKWGCATSHAF